MASPIACTWKGHDWVLHTTSSGEQFKQCARCNKIKSA
jgi:hypothetical protein